MNSFEHAVSPGISYLQFSGISLAVHGRESIHKVIQDAVESRESNSKRKHAD